MKKMSYKGFTLVELLVVIVILGVVTGITIPIIRNTQENTEESKYSTYASTLLSGAKLYLNSYEEDLFGHHDSGCSYVSFKQLLEKKMIKDIDIEGISCNSESTFVKIIKLNGRYSYSYYMGCGEKEQDKAKSVTISFPVL